MQAEIIGITESDSTRMVGVALNKILIVLFLVLMRIELGFSQSIQVNKSIGFRHTYRSSWFTTYKIKKYGQGIYRVTVTVDHSTRFENGVNKKGIHGF